MRIDEILFHVPCPIFWKDLTGVFLGCNKLFLPISGLNNYDDLIGKTDIELPWKKFTFIHRFLFGLHACINDLIS